MCGFNIIPPSFAQAPVWNGFAEVTLRTPTGLESTGRKFCFKVYFYSFCIFGIRRGGGQEGMKKFGVAGIGNDWKGSQKVVDCLGFTFVCSSIAVFNTAAGIFKWRLGTPLERDQKKESNGADCPLVAYEHIIIIRVPTSFDISIKQEAGSMKYRYEAIYLQLHILER